MSKLAYEDNWYIHLLISEFTNLLICTSPYELENLLGPTGP
jgi:hypothetical protein